jgi:predicted NBD/HSP70 family sugar kinase
MHTRVALADTAGHVVAEDVRTIDVDKQGAAALDEAAHLVAALLERARIGHEELLAVAAGIPGPLDRRRQVVISPTILGSWIDFAPAAELGRRLGREVLIENDADMGATGEKRFGIARGYTDFLYIKASHGIGASVVIGGRCYPGARGFAGEIGHTQLPGALNHCRCGNRGCLEAVISVPEVRRQLASTHLRGDPDRGEPPLTDVARDPVGSRILADAGRMVGRVVADGCNWLNPEAVILGGELGVSGPPFAEGFRESLDRYAQPATAEAVTVDIAGLGSRSEVMGAIAMAIDRCAAP